MPSGSVPVLWLCGPSGVGKSTVGWAIYSELVRAGVPVAFVDHDQLGLCYPAPATDRDNHAIKARNLAAVWTTFRLAGARCLVMSGGITSRASVQAYLDRLSDVALTVCRLRVGDGELRARFINRGWQIDLADDAVSEAAELASTDFADFCVDTDRRSVTDVAATVLSTAGGWPDLPTSAGSETGSLPQQLPSSTASTSALWICGPRGVGKSTVGYEVFTRIVQTGVKSAYLDLDQIGRCPPATGDPGNIAVRASNVGLMWPTFRAAGARLLVITGGACDEDTGRSYADAIGDTDLAVCRLRADRTSLTERLLRRGAGGGPPLPGDDLIGVGVDELHHLADHVFRTDEAHEPTTLHETAVDTSALTVAQIADAILERAGLIRILTV